MKQEKEFKLPREDHLDVYMKLSAEEILEWLYQANQFISQIKKPKK